MMARKNGNKKEESGNRKRDSGKGGDSELTKSVVAVAAFILAILFALSYIGKGGSAGNFIFRVFEWLLGGGYFFAPLALLLVGFSLFFSGELTVLRTTLAGGALFLLSSLLSFHIFFGGESGGFLGAAVGAPLLSLFDFWASAVITLGAIIISFLLIYRVSLSQIMNWVKAGAGSDEEEGGTGAEGAAVEPIISSDPAALPVVGASEAEVPSLPASAGVEKQISGSHSVEGLTFRKIAKKFDYKKPPLELLAGDRGTPSTGDIRATANTIKRTLENFGITVDMGEVSIGPTVTQYTLKPAEGVKLSRIVALHSDLSLALAAHPIRIEAPIPGKSLAGIEVPNRSVATVGLRALLEHSIFRETPNLLLLTLGRDVSGAPVFADLARMPHLLISGATGAGKSVSIHSIITSLVYRNPPEILRFIMVDPKRVELSVYNDIPHLLTPVITDPRKTIQALRWATKEMDRRYDLLSGRQARDIASYNVKAEKSKEEAALPYIVIIIDELADLMATFPREVESAIIRLAQMARAVGIHLIVATQRPSVEVITGLIKANITSRIAFQVASQVDSRTILDMAGAEKLLGSGDMLFLAGDTAKPRRIQGAIVTEQEVKRVVDFLREDGDPPSYDEEIFSAKTDEDRLGDESESDGEDPLYEEARTLVVEAGKASSSYLQRRLRIGYARAARLLDIMEGRGVIGPAEGTKSREVIARSSEDAV